MLRVSRLTDYGILLLGHMSQGPRRHIRANTRELAEASGLPMTTVGKILKILAKERILVSHRGATGGYTLAREPEQITMAEVYSALEGPIEVTHGGLEAQVPCAIGANWHLMNQAVRHALQSISLLDMTTRLAEHPTALSGV